MQIRPKAYLHLISRWRSLRNSILPHHGDAPAETSPLLMYVAVVLVFLLVILEIDLHRGALETLGLLATDYPTPAAFMGP